MPRKKSSLWLRHLELFSIATGARPKKRAGKPRPATQKAAKKVVQRTIKPAVAAPAAKRTGTAPAARAPSVELPGTWLRSFHSAGPSAGRLVNHLAYALYLPAAPAKTAGMPAIVMLHGCKQTAESFAAGTRICRLAERAGFAVLFPEQAKTTHAHRCWHWHGDATESEAAAVASLVDAIVRRHGFDRDRIYVAGLSAGAGLAAVLALRYPDRFAAVGLHSGPAIAPPSSTMAAMSLMRRGLRDDPIAALDACADVASYPGMPALVIHGALDTVVTDRNATQLGIAFARLNRLVDEHGAIRVGEQRSYAQDDADYVDYLKGGGWSSGCASSAGCRMRGAAGTRASRSIPPRDRTRPRCSGISFVVSAASDRRDARRSQRPLANGRRHDVKPAAPALRRPRGRRHAEPATVSGRSCRAPARWSRRSRRDDARRCRARPTARAPCPARPASW